MLDAFTWKLLEVMGMVILLLIGVLVFVHYVYGMKSRKQSRIEERAIDQEKTVGQHELDAWKREKKAFES
ncbi:hypothetical protein KJ765_01990 [Candidatus Micrarchaeota archaeon]|nr:hypothetical protein [Candidatus Micrarchaeota archaeon]